MKLATWTCILCIETALALYFGVSAAVSYGLAASLTCLESRSKPMTLPCAVPSVRPMLRTSASRNLLTNSTAKEGWATWYSRQSCRREGTSGVLTASGRKYDENSTTIALPFHPEKWGKSYRITNLSNGKSITAKHWDYGPGKRARSRGVITDLSPKVFESIGGKLRDGRMRVKIEAI